MSVNNQAFYDALGERESSGSYNAENQYGFLGKYQMGEMALIDAGYYNNDGNMYKNDWKGTWNYDIEDKNDFLNNQEAQEDAIENILLSDGTAVDIASLQSATQGDDIKMLQKYTSIKINTKNYKTSFRSQEHFANIKKYFCTCQDGLWYVAVNSRNFSIKREVA